MKAILHITLAMLVFGGSTSYCETSSLAVLKIENPHDGRGEHKNLVLKGDGTFEVTAYDGRKAVEVLSSGAHKDIFKLLKKIDSASAVFKHTPAVCRMASPPDYRVVSIRNSTKAGFRVVDANNNCAAAWRVKLETEEESLEMLVATLVSIAESILRRR